MNELNAKYNEINKELKENESRYTPFMVTLITLSTLVVLGIDYFVPVISVVIFIFFVLPFISAFLMLHLDKSPSDLNMKQRIFFKTYGQAFKRMIWRPLISVKLFLFAFLWMLLAVFVWSFIVTLISLYADPALKDAINQMSDVVFKTPFDYNELLTVYEANKDVIYVYDAIMSGIIDVTFYGYLTFGIVNNFFKEYYYLTFNLDNYVNVRNGGRYYKPFFSKKIHTPLFAKHVWPIVLLFVGVYALALTGGILLKFDLNALLLFALGISYVALAFFLPYLTRMEQTLFQMYLKMDGVQVVDDLINDINANRLMFQYNPNKDMTNIITKRFVSMLILLKKQLLNKDPANPNNPANSQETQQNQGETENVNPGEVPSDASTLDEETSKEEQEKKNDGDETPPDNKNE